MVRWFIFIYKMQLQYFSDVCNFCVILDWK